MWLYYFCGGGGGACGCGGGGGCCGGGGRCVGGGKGFLCRIIWLGKVE